MSANREVAWIQQHYCVILINCMTTGIRVKYYHVICLRLVVFTISNKLIMNNLEEFLNLSQAFERN